MDKKIINKDLFDFKLCTTSFIYPDNIIPNVRKLGPFFDEIELLIFESIPCSVLPSPRDIKELKNLAQEFDLTYNIHLPVDVSLTDISRTKRDQAVETIKQVIDITGLLNPTTHTLHLEFEEYKNSSLNYDDWYKRSFDAMGKLCALLDKPEIISMETLDYPFESIAPIIDEYQVSVCVDAGHLIKYGHDIKRIFEKYHDKIPLIHLHGVDFSMVPPKDHVSLEKMPKEKFIDTLEVLKKFKGVVSIEVFNKDNLISSLDFLKKNF
jgi:sugar phosphate isomerase/epimerase